MVKCNQTLIEEPFPPILINNIGHKSNRIVNNVEKSLNRYGIAIRSDKDTFKSFSDVLTDVSSKWKTYTDVQKNDISTQLAGTRQRNQFLTLMDNMNMALGQQATEANSAGNAMDRYGTYAKSTEAKMNDLKNTVQQFWMQLVNSSTINSAISSVTNLVNNLKTLETVPIQAGRAIDVLAVAIIAFTVATAKIGAAGIDIVIWDMIKAVVTYTSTMKFATIATDALALADKGLAVAIEFLTSPFAIIAGVLAVLTIGVINYTQHLTDLKQQTDSLKTSYDGLTTAMKNNDTAGMKTNADSLKGTQSNLQNLLKQKADLEKQIASASSSGMGEKELNSTLVPELQKVNSLLADQTKELTDAGIQYNSLTGEIDSVTQAEKLMTSQNDWTKANTNIQYYNQLLAEAKDKGTLTAASINDIKQNHLELLPVLDLLKNKNGELYNYIESKITEETNKENEANRVKIENDTGYYNSKIKSDSNLREIIYDNTKNLVDIQGKSYGIDLNNYTTVAQLKVAIDNKARAAIGDGWAKTFGSMEEGVKQASKLYSAIGAQESTFTKGQSTSYTAMSNNLSGLLSSYWSLDTKYESLGGSGGYSPQTLSGGSGSSDSGSYMPSGGTSSSKSSNAAAAAAKKLETDTESAITTIIKDELAKRKSAIDDYYNALKTHMDDEKAAYDKQYETDQYNQKLKTEQNKLGDINASIASASRDTSSEGQARLKDLTTQAQAEQAVIDQMILDNTKKNNDLQFDAQNKLIAAQQKAAQDALIDQYSDANIKTLAEQAWKNGSFIDLLTGQSRSVSSVPLPSYAVGASQILGQQTAIVHDGESILPKSINPFLGGASYDRFMTMMMPKVNMPQISNINNNTNKGVNVNFNTPLISVAGDCSAGIIPTLKQLASDTKDMVMGEFIGQLSNQGVYIHP